MARNRRSRDALAPTVCARRLRARAHCDTARRAARRARRMNPRRRCVELRTSAHTMEAEVLQKAADFLKAFMLGFDVPDALALLRLDDLFVESFDVRRARAP